MSALVEDLKSEIEHAAGAPSILRRIFESLRSDVGGATASQLWWDAFAETDAAET